MGLALEKMRLRKGHQASLLIFYERSNLPPFAADKWAIADIFSTVVFLLQNVDCTEEDASVKSVATANSSSSRASGTLAGSRLSVRNGRSVVHKNLEDNYGAVISANHEALAQILEQVPISNARLISTVHKMHIL